MSAIPPQPERGKVARPDKDGRPTFDWTLTSSSLADTVKLVAGPFNALPVVFVPGIMGSNLKALGSKPKPVWRLDSSVGLGPLGLAAGVGPMGPGERQKLLHPDKCVVDDDGAVPSSSAGSIHNASEYKERGWGTVGEGSYHAFLSWLEEQLNPLQRNPALWQDYYQAEATVSAPLAANTQPRLPPGIKMGMKGEPFHAERQPFAPVMTDDLIARSKFFMPVYAAGYNWLASNDKAAKALSKRIEQIIASYNKGQYRCQQVILVTHSMGGLVARGCAQLPGMADKIAGVVHGVMPAVGAAVAYRRCKLGMREEDFGAGLVIGSNGQEVTAVFAQAPGALQLLPSQRYHPGWLRVAQAKAQPALNLPKAGSNGTCDPYAEIYGVRDKWWGLINEAWLSPKDGAPIRWEQYLNYLKPAREFHEALGCSYHPNTYVYYGADPKKPSFENMTWRVKPGLSPDRATPPAMSSVLGMSASQVRMDGTNPEYVGGQTEIATASYDMVSSTSVTETSYWELLGEMQDGAGDGTVPVSSGAAPLVQGGSAIRQQFKLTGFAHEPSFKDGLARAATLYAITKIVGTAKKPA